MPDEAAAVTAPVAPATNAAQPMVAAKPVAGETFAQQMERFGGFTLADGTPAPDDGTPSKAAPDAADTKLARKAKGKKGKAAAAPPAAAGATVAAAVEAAPATAQAAAAPAVDKLAQLKALAAELNLDVDGAGVTARERVEFREAKKKLNDRIQQQEREVLQRLEQARQQFTGQLSRAEKLDAAAESGDYEGLAQLLGKKDWNALQEDVIARLSDPNYKRLQELEQYRQQQEVEKQQRQQQYERQTQVQRQNAARAEHVQNLQAQMKSSADPLVSAMYDDPQFVAAVIEVQRQNWDGHTTVSPEKAIKIAAQGFPAPLQQHMRGLYDRLQKVFGATPAQAAAVVQAVAPAAEAAPVVESKKNRTGVIPAAATGGAPSAAKTKMTKKEHDKIFSERLAAAIAEDRG